MTVKRYLIWLCFRSRRSRVLFILITCFLISSFHLLQDLDNEGKRRVYVEARTAKTNQVTKLSTLSPREVKNVFHNISHRRYNDVLNNNSKTNIFAVLKNINEKSNQKLLENINDKKIQKLIPKDSGIIAVKRQKVLGKTMKTVTKKAVRLQSFAHFSYPMEIDLPREIEKISNGTPSGIKPINPHAYSYIHGAYDFCDNLSSSNFKDNDLFLLILVKSSVSNFERRKSIRLSWNNHTYYKQINFKTLFMLGYNDSLKNEIKLESSKYNDIIQENFKEAYLNNTLKMIMGFNWAVTHCKKARYIFFVDDDYFVHVGNLGNYLLKLHPDKERRFIAGYLLPRSVPYRDNMTKWYIPLEDYPFDRWPPYLAGGAFVASMVIARKFQLAFPFVKYIGIDDSYLGIVAKKLHIQLFHSFNFCYRPCKSRLKTAFASHGFAYPQDMIGAWKNQLHNKIVYVFKNDFQRVKKKP